MEKEAINSPTYVYSPALLYIYVGFIVKHIHTATVNTIIW